MREISAGIIIYRRAPARNVVYNVAGGYSRPGSHAHPAAPQLEFLILYHGRGYWNFAKGKIESSPSQILNGKTWAGKEKSWEAAVREVREETGLKISDLRFRKNFKAYEKFVFQRQKEKVFKIVIFYLAEAKKSEIKISKEHEGFGWFTYKEAMKILGKYRDSQRVLTQAMDFIKRGERKES